MTTIPESPTRIRIEAPGASAAFMLEKRLSHLHPVVVGRGPNWYVELEDFDDRVDEIVAAVRHWLAATGGRAAGMRVDGTLTTVTPSTSVQELALGYDDGIVLEHEP